jgi:HlyD family secretion protein
VKAATKPVLVLLVLAAAAAGLWYAWQSRPAGGEAKYRLARVERGPLAAVVAASGTLNAVATVQVGSQISGQVKEIHADFNTPVKKGQVIARLDPATFELRVSQARADLDAAASAVAVARAGRVSEAQLRTALAAMKHRESLLRQAQADLERTLIRAPVDGTVILRNVDAGQTVAASAQAPVLFAIARDLRDMQVEAAIDEADAGRLRVGMAASLAVDAFPRRSFSGEIRQIRKSPQSAQNAASYTVVIWAGNPDLALLPGMTANVRVVVEERAGALKVPNAALRWRPAGAEAPADPPRGRARERRSTVYVLQDGAPRAVEVGLGITDGASTEILGDTLAEGVEVIVAVAP